MTAISEQHAHVTWVPGSMDRVRIAFRTVTRELSITRLGRVFGRQAIEAMYLKGRHRQTVPHTFELEEL
ncbi:hypothetical protein [Deinococcus pimensis]|uniref:hypothetical protein n=1 Tax=Deinococcus pimensis TaxID=309888 RepID=UPI0004B1F9A5|nr:hypothetical protein [Deinococcus pimensis]